MRVRFLIVATGSSRTLLWSLGAAAPLFLGAPPAAAQQQPDSAERIAEVLRAARKPRPPVVLATPPFAVAATQLAGCFVVNLGTAAQSLTVTMRTDDGSPPSVSIVAGQPNFVSGQETIINTTQPVQLSCEFAAGDISLIRGSGTVFDGSRRVLQVIPAN